jgi:hypothetical protein
MWVQKGTNTVNKNHKMVNKIEGGVPKNATKGGRSQQAA